ncbi:MAG: cytochrome c [Gemmatimonadota bacterium]|nr:cytochrome c [Gemmatimonadota bacterium]
MSKTIPLAALAWTIVLGAPDRAAAQDAPPEVTYRQNLMQAIRTNVIQLRSVAEVGHPDHTVHYARALYGIGEILGDAFREGSAANSGALQDVWNDHSEFQEQVEFFRSATGELLEAAEMRDAAAIQEGIQSVGGTCSACHQDFRAPND